MGWHSHGQAKCMSSRTRRDHKDLQDLATGCNQRLTERWSERPRRTFSGGLRLEALRGKGRRGRSAKGLVVTHHKTSMVLSIIGHVLKDCWPIHYRSIERERFSADAAILLWCATVFKHLATLPFTVPRSGKVKPKQSGRRALLPAEWTIEA
jgi:hypothetical protein